MQHTPEPPMTTHMSTKGQVVIPRALRDKMRLRCGTPLSVQKIGGKIILEPIKSRSHPIRELFGILHRPGVKPMSVRDMDQTIGDFVMADYRRVLQQKKRKKRK